jgi:hypothetical protein
VVGVFRKARTIYGKKRFSENIKFLSFDTGQELSGDMMLESSRLFDRWLRA